MPPDFRYHHAVNGILLKHRNPLEGGAVTRRWTPSSLEKLLVVSPAAARRYLSPFPPGGAFTRDVVDDLLEALHGKLPAPADGKKTKSPLLLLIEELGALERPEVMDAYAYLYRQHKNLPLSEATAAKARPAEISVEWKPAVDHVPFKYSWPMTEKPRHAMYAIWYALHGGERLSWLQRMMDEKFPASVTLARRCQENVRALEFALQAMGWAIGMNGARMKGFQREDKIQMRLSFYMRIPAPAASPHETKEFLCRILRCGDVDTPSQPQGSSLGDAPMVPIDGTSKFAICNTMHSNVPIFVVGEEADLTLVKTGVKADWKTLAVLARSMAQQPNTQRNGVLAIDIRAPRHVNNNGRRAARRATMAHLRWLKTNPYIGDEMMRSAVFMARAILFAPDVVASMETVRRAVDEAASV